MKLKSAVLGLVVLLSVAAQAEDAPAAVAGGHHLYLMNEVIESSAKLQPGEVVLWYGAIPTDVVVHGAIGFACGGPYVAAAAAGVNMLHVVPSVMGAEFLRLQAEATIRANSLVNKITNIQDNHVLGMMSLSGGTTEQVGIFISKINQRSVYFLNLESTLPENFSVNIPTPEGTTKLVTFSRVDDPKDVLFTFTLTSGEEIGNPWIISLADLTTGKRLPAEIEDQWKELYEKNEKTAKIILKMALGNQTVELGSFTEGHGVKGFLGTGLLGKASYYIRTHLLHSKDNLEGKKLRLKNRDMQKQDPAPYNPL